MADRNGNLENRPRLLKVEILPHDPVDIDKLTNELMENGLIDIYEEEGKSFIAILSWTKHGRAHPSEPVCFPVKTKRNKTQLNASARNKKRKSVSYSNSTLDSSSSLNSTSNSSLTSSSLAAPLAEEKTARPRNEVFDAIAEVTGTDGSTNSLIGKVAATLKKANPPYTPEEIREFGRRFWEFCQYAARDDPPRDRPTPNEIEKNIGRVRAPPAPIQVAKTTGKIAIGEASATFTEHMRSKE